MGVRIRVLPERTAGVARRWAVDGALSRLDLTGFGALFGLWREAATNRSPETPLARRPFCLFMW